MHELFISMIWVVLFIFCAIVTIQWLVLWKWCLVSDNTKCTVVVTLCAMLLAGYDSRNRLSRCNIPHIPLNSIITYTSMYRLALTSTTSGWQIWTSDSSRLPPRGGVLATPTMPLAAINITSWPASGATHFCFLAHGRNGKAKFTLADRQQTYWYDTSYSTKRL